MRLLPAKLRLSHTSPSLPVTRSARFCVHVLASELPGLSLLPEAQPCDRTKGMLAMVYNWFAEPFADSERIALLVGGMHGLVFRRSIHYWQDQPGSTPLAHPSVWPERLLASVEPHRSLEIPPFPVSAQLKRASSSLSLVLPRGVPQSGAPSLPPLSPPVWLARKIQACLLRG